MEASSTVELLEPADVQLGFIGYNDLPRVWPEIAPLVEKACEWSGGSFTPEGVVDGMGTGELLMLSMIEGGRIVSIMVATVGVFRSGLKVFECLLVGGRDMKSWMPFEHYMDEYARELGCARVRCIGRKPLLKMLPHWHFVGVMLEREI